MTETILVSTLLFKNSTRELTHFPGVSVGTVAPAGVGISSYRTSGVVGVKISAVARVTDAMMDKKIDAVCGPATIYTEFLSRDGNVYKAMCDGKNIDFIGDRPERNWEAFIPLFIFETRPNADNKELIGAMKRLPEQEALYLMCDSFYYGCAQRRNVTISVNETSSTVVEAAVRSGLLSEKHPLCNEVGFGGDTFSASTSDSGSSASPSKEKGEDEMEHIRSGKYAIAYDWSDEQKQRIPALKSLDDFVPTAAFWKGSRKIKFRTDKILTRMDMGLSGLEALGKDAINFFMTGKPGTGKTTVAKNVVTKLTEEEYRNTTTTYKNLLYG